MPKMTCRSCEPCRGRERVAGYSIASTTTRSMITTFYADTAWQARRMLVESFYSRCNRDSTLTRVQYGRPTLSKWNKESVSSRLKLRTAICGGCSKEGTTRHGYHFDYRTGRQGDRSLGGDSARDGPCDPRYRHRPQVIRPQAHQGRSA